MKVTDEMVNRFLCWKLPENFSPDGGIMFKRTFNENTPWPMKHEPCGTNLLDGEQSRSMLEFVLGLAQPRGEPTVEGLMKLADNYARSYKPKLKFGSEYRESRRDLESALRDALAPSQLAQKSEFAQDQWWVEELKSIHGCLDKLTPDQYRAIRVALRLVETLPPTLES